MTGVELTLLVGGIVNVVATAFAAYAAWRSAGAADKSADVAKEQVAAALMQKQLAQRQFIIQLWDRMAAIQPINAADPVPALVHAATSTMELIALCCEGGMIDAAVIKRTYTDNYIRLYDMVAACGPITSMENKTGPQLLGENPAAMNFYHELKKEKMEAGRLQKT